MSQDVYGNVLAALRGAGLPGLSRFHPGAPLPSLITNAYYFPDKQVPQAAQAFNTTATRLYYWPHYFGRGDTFQGAAVWNSGAGDNGKKLRLGLYTHGAAGPASLIKAFGEITLTGASAERLLLSSVTVPIGWVWFAIHTESLTAMYGGTSAISAAGGAEASGFFQQDFGIIAPAVNITASTYPGLYVDTAYGALASTAVAPTASLFTAATPCPSMALKV